LITLDNTLLSVFASGDFVWESELISAFPREMYWYLWGAPSI